MFALVVKIHTPLRIRYRPARPSLTERKKKRETDKFEKGKFEKVRKDSSETAKEERRKKKECKIRIDSKRRQ